VGDSAATTSKDENKAIAKTVNRAKRIFFFMGGLLKKTGKFSSKDLVSSASLSF
jgi:hypothetical protein